MIDKLLPVLVGHRTELLALGAAVIKFLGDIHVIDPAHVSEVLGVLVPVAGATFAAKVSRLGELPPKPPTIVVSPP